MFAEFETNKLFCSFSCMLYISECSHQWLKIISLYWLMEIANMFKAKNMFHLYFYFVCNLRPKFKYNYISTFFIKYYTYNKILLKLFPTNQLIYKFADSSVEKVPTPRNSHSKQNYINNLSAHFHGSIWHRNIGVFS